MAPGTSTPPPLYRALERDLRSDIGRGAYTVGELLPTETELAEIHRVSRHTVRAALRRLDELGLIERRPGVGTRLVADRPVEPFRPIATSPDDILTVVDTTRIVRIEQELTATILEDEMAEALEAPAGSPALVVIRRHWAGSRALSAVGVHTHPADRSPIRWQLCGEDD